ncbi:MAG: LPS export ABC transporter permease LptG [Proteobacteria bacterium]|nr:LPS export ABC transporter permease LptG [Pseudomonadota bacterium]
MRLSTTLSGYIGRNFLLSFTALFGLFLLLIFLFDTVELMRRAAAKPDIPFSLVMEMALLKLPHMAQQTFPFAILFGGMMAFWRLTRTQELVITRAAGVSVWQFLLPVLGISFLLGLFQIGILNPLASTTITRYERLEAVNLKGQKSFLALSQTGLWLRQANTEGQSVVHSDFILQAGKDVELREVIVFNYKGNDQFAGRIDAEYARLEDGFWHITNAWVHIPNEQPRFEKDYWLATDLTLNRIQDSFAPPETMSFWDLSGFIGTLEKAGFSAVRHRLYWHSLLASPFLMCAMVLIAATFTLRHSRQGGGIYIIAGGVLTGFILYFFSDIVFALGLSDSIPVTLAAWTPSGVATLLGLATLLHLEDG